MSSKILVLVLFAFSVPKFSAEHTAQKYSAHVPGRVIPPSSLSSFRDVRSTPPRLQNTRIEVGLTPPSMSMRFLSELLIEPFVNAWNALTAWINETFYPEGIEFTAEFCH